MWLPVLIIFLAITCYASKEERSAKLIVLPPIVIGYEDIDFRNYDYDDATKKPKKKPKKEKTKDGEMNLLE
ncbi:hypothetical protein evm_010983 [Chilo suppressalis]|nr:hypothetical protein evm_010983 [Chilo suppressalis]